MKMRSILGLLLGFQGAFCSAEPWYLEQDPKLWSSDLVLKFDSLPKSQALTGKDIPWTTTYWPDHKSGVAHRWANNFPEDFSYVPPSLERLKKMISTERNKLSPAEKWDILHSNYDYPTVASERKRTKKDQVSWAGLCHGWGLSAISFVEPESYRMVNAEGIELVLNSTDIKALASLAVSEQAIQDSLLLGTKCYRSGRENRTNLNTAECAGVNAGTFHLVMTNSLGVQKKPFITNVSRDEQIWNHPVYGYETEVLSEAGPSRRSSPETIREIRVETFLYTVEMQDPLTPDPVQGTLNHPLSSVKYVYWLELNAQGNIVGGTWETFWHPGFIWKNKNPVREFTGAFMGLEKVLKSR
jgi:hypothetical protein